MLAADDHAHDDLRAARETEAHDRPVAESVAVRAHGGEEPAVAREGPAAGDAEVREDGSTFAEARVTGGLESASGSSGASARTQASERFTQSMVPQAAAHDLRLGEAIPDVLEHAPVRRVPHRTPGS